MSSLREEELINILPKNGPTVEEVKKYLEKYNDEFIIAVSYTHLTLPTMLMV